MTSQYSSICSDFAMKGKSRMDRYPGPCSRQVPNMFKLTKIGPPMINGMSKHLYISNLGLLAQSEYFCRGLPIELEYTQKLGPPAAPLNPPPGPPWGSKKISGGFRHLVRSNPCHLAQETSQNHHLGLLSPPPQY